MGRQALKLADGRDACAWSPTEINAACEALNILTSKTLEAVGDEGLTGQVIMLGLALRRAAPGAPGISDAQRTAYTSLHLRLTDELLEIQAAITNDKLSPGSALELCTALVKTHTLRAFCPLLAAASTALLPPPGQPQPRAPHLLVQSSFVLLQEASNALGLIVDVLKRYPQPDACQPLLSLLETELAESGLLEHWSRLALALGGCEGAEEEAAKLTMQMGLDLKVLVQKKWDYDSLAGGGRAWDCWSELLLSGSSPSLVYLLSSHLVALAAELDGGPTYGLPAAPEEERAAGPSGSAPAPAPRGRPLLPLLDTNGYRLRLGPGQPVDMRLAGFALYLLVRCLHTVETTTTAASLEGPPAVCWPVDAALTNQAIVRRTCAARLRGLEEKVADAERRIVEAVGVEGPSGKAMGDRDAADAKISLKKEECAKVLAALRRREPFADVAAAYQLGMRLARAAALSLQGCPGLTAASCGASGEGAWEALVAAHDPSGWQDPASPPLPPPGSATAGRLASGRVAEVAWRALSLARTALLAAIDMQDTVATHAVLPWQPRQLGSWWRAAMAWAGLYWQQEGQLLAVLGLVSTSSLIVIRRRVASMLGGPSTDVIAAARAGLLRAFEGLIRHPDGLRSVFSRGLLPEATWTDLLTHSQAADVASLAGTVAKLLRRRPSPEEGLGDVTALARRFGLMAERGVPGEGLQRRHVAVQAATGGASGAVPAVGSATASGDGSGAGSDLPLSAACIALQLLPEAARVGRALAEAVLPRLSALAPPPDLRPLEDLVALLLDWMPPLVLAARPLGGVGEGAGAGAAADWGAAEAAASPAQAAPAAGAWDKLLWRQLDPAWALAAALRLVPTCSGLRSPLRIALWALAVRQPEGLCMMLKDSKIDESAEASMQQISEILRQTTGCPWELERPETGPGARTLLGPSIRLLREALGPGGACEEPQLLTQLEALSACSSLSEAADLGRGLGASPGPAQLYAGATAVLASPAEARRALPGCSNPACTNLAGPSEAALSVQRCGGGCGGAARYCCEGCREAHWAAGHAEECGAAGGSSPAGVQGG